jgi:hypothetical protein
MEGFIRPQAVEVSESAIVPDDNFISPPPNQFTHELTREQPFYYLSLQQGVPPDGQFAPGTKVVLLVCEGDDYCRVVDGQGLYVEVECDSLKKL